MAERGRPVKIAVLGDEQSGKTSLVSTAANDTFDARPVPTLPPTKLPLDFTPERVPILITDTSAKPEDARALDEVIKDSDAVVVCFDPKKPATLASVRTTWYPRVQKLNPDIPIILACCKADRLSDRDSPSIRESVERVARDLPNVECCLNCSSRFNKMVHDVFYYALKAVLYPLQPLYDRTDRVMRQAAVRALKRVFIIFDQDKDATLSDMEINTFQHTCFGISLSSEELRGIKQVVRAQVPGGYTDTGLTLEGFLFLQGLFIERGRLETVWQVLRRFGYNDQLRLSDELLDRVATTGLPHDQVFELSDAAVEFLEQLFTLYDARGENLLSWEQLQGLFSTAPNLPTEWQNERINRLMVNGTYGAVHSPDAFLARWRYCALTDPRATLAHLLYLGYDGQGGPSDLLVRRVRRRPDKRHREDMAKRNSALCYVFGSAGSGKSTLLRVLAGRRADDGAAGAGTPGGAAGGVGTPLASYSGRASGTPPLTALANVSCEDDVYRTLALVEISQDLAQEMLTAATLAPHRHGGAHSTSPSRPAALLPLGSPGSSSGAAATSAASASASTGPSTSATPAPSEGGSAPGEPAPAAGSAGAASSSSSAPPPAIPVGHAVHGPMGPPYGPLGLGGLPDLAHCDCAVFVFDSTNVDSWRWAHEAMLKLCSLPGCESLPVVLVAAKDDVGMCEELKGEVEGACRELALPGTLPAAAQDTSAMHGVFRQTLSAALLYPDTHVPDTPARKARRRMQRQLVIGGLAVGAVALGGYVLYSMCASDGPSGGGSGSRGAASAGGAAVASSVRAPAAGLGPDVGSTVKGVFGSLLS